MLNTIDATTFNPLRLINIAYSHLRNPRLTESVIESESTTTTITERGESAKDSDIELKTWLHLAGNLEIALPIELAIVVGFYNIEQVQCIYIQDLPEVYSVFVLLNQSHYDDELMDQLLDREIDILDSNKDKLFGFHYIPILEDAPKQSIPKNAVLIFVRPQ